MQFEEIVSVEEVEDGETYDLEIDSEDHSFLANDISVSNSHAVSYAYLSYQCAYLFHHYPEEWVCSYLENDPNTEGATEEVTALGYKIGKFDILSSGRKYTLVGDTIFPPFSLIKGVGEIAMDELFEVRSKWKDSGEGLKNFESFFYDIEQRHLKNGTVKFKRTWKFTKCNKRAIEGLVRLEAFGSLGIFPEPFLNHAHLYRVLIDNWDQRDKQKFDVAALAQSSPTSDFSDSDRVTAQAELLGIYDKNLLITEDVIDFLRDQDILPLTDLADYPQKIWFILKKVETGVTKNGKEYFKLFISDITGQEMKMNYFFFAPREGWQPNTIYWAELFRKQGFINNSHGSFIRSLR